MDSKRRAELSQRLCEEPLSKTEKEQRVLDVLEWSLADFVPHTRESIAEVQAVLLLDNPPLWPSYIEKCENARWAWETLSGLVRLYRQRAQARSERVSPTLFLPPPLTNWVLDVACGYLKRPKWKGRPKLNDSRDRDIGLAVVRLGKLGRPLAPPSKGSACAEIAERLGMKLSTVRGIWFKQRERVEALWDMFGDDHSSVYDTSIPKLR